MSKHTTGPWKANFHNTEPAVLDYGNVMVALVVTDEDKPQEPEEVVGNARLIAAAPELLAALSALVDAAVEVYDGQSSDFPGLVAATERACAAIAKSEGRGE